MNSFSARLSALWRGLLLSFRDFPVEAFISVGTFILTILSNEEVLHSGFPVYFFLPLLILTFCLHRFALRSGAAGWKICYFASALCWISLAVWRPELSDAGKVVLYILAFILLFASEGRQDNGHYAGFILHALVKGVSALLVAGVLSLVMLALIASVDFLFIPSRLAERWYVYPQLFIWMVMAPMLCCAFESEPPEQWKGRRFLTILVEYILTPALLAYAAILYLYMLRILILWKLPDGGVAYLVSGFVGVTLVCRLLQELLTKRHFDWFYKFFPYVALGPIVLLWIGIFRRTGEYGLTEMRVYLIAGSLLLTLFTGMLLFARTRSFFRMSLIAGGVALLLTFIPGISARDWGLRNQRNRFEKVLPELLVNGKFPEKVPYKAILASEELQRKWERCASAFNYLQKEMGLKHFEEVYGAYGTCSYNDYALEEVRREASSPEPENAPSVCYKLEEAVPLGDYTLLLPESTYHYYEDSSVVIFYEDDSREKELLRCPVTERLDDPSSPSAQDKLVYRNDRYLAVFEIITDYRCVEAGPDFITGRHSLYARP